MFVPPIIHRELRVALRKHHAIKARFRIAMIAAGAVCLNLLFGIFSGLSTFGGGLHWLLFIAGLYLAVIPPARISVGLFCEERRNQTLELLYLTGMTSGELFLGKLLGGILISSSELLALAPCLAVPFLSGGISLDLFLATIGCFPALLLFTVAIGVLASVLCRDDGAALVCAIVLGGGLCLAVPLPHILGNMVAGAPPFSASWLCLSPAYGPWLVGKNFAGATPGAFWLNAAITILWALVALVMAAILLTRNWRQEIVRSRTNGLPGAGDSWIHGSAAWRATLRRRLLDANAFQWLAQHDRRPVLLAWALLGMVVFGWLLGWAAWPRFWPSPVNLYVTAFVLVTGMGLIMTYAAARTIGTERREGSLELLLTTPLTPQEMLAGQAAAINEQFRLVREILLGLCLLMMLGGFFTRAWSTPAIISYVLIWSFFLMACISPNAGKVPVAMWTGLNTGRPMYALFHGPPTDEPRSKGRFYWWFYLFVNSQNLWRGLLRAGSFPSGSVFELIVVVGASIAVLGFKLARKSKASPEILAMQRRLVAEMRLIARRPLLDPRDPLFKKWNLNNNAEAMSAYVESYPERTGKYMGRKLGNRWARWQRRW